MHKAILFEKRGNKAVRCTACNNYCIISEGRSGICGVRKNINGELYLLVYGRAAAAHIDPMEKKPLFHFLPGEQIFTIGTIGCNFACDFCQNWDISQAGKSLRNKPPEEAKELLEYGYRLSPSDIIDACKEKGIKAVAFSYNEPVIFFEYAFDTMKLAKKEGIRTVFVSNGYESEEALESMKGYLDAMNIDIKAFNDDFYRRLCKARLAPVLETVKKAHSLGIWIECTTLFVPGENDSEDEMGQIADFISSVSRDIPWHVTAFYPQYKMTDKEPTGHSTLIRAHETGKKKLDYVYVGNVYDRERSATYCPQCRTRLIDRDYYETRILSSMKKGRCAECNQAIPGVFP